MVESVYPSKNFMNDAKRAWSARDALEISIHGGWRGRMLAKEVALWLPIDEIELLNRGPWHGPSIRCGWLMMHLHAIHYMMLSANYEMHYKIDCDHVVLTYQPL
ncbi:hypothetical protein HSX11_23665 [Oxalobacteraceae bacterium]|nr:hypothetical protein [Oxalobacteraceae bacterium]